MTIRLLTLMSQTLLLLRDPACAQADPPPLQSSTTTLVIESPRRRASVAYLATLATEAADGVDRLSALDELGRTEPRSFDDLRLLLDLFTRGEPKARQAAENSLGRLPREAQSFGPFFNNLLLDSDPFFQTFGMIGAYRLRYAPALSPIRDLASKPFKFPNPGPSLMPLESNRWHSQFQALRVLALWEGKEALPLLTKRAKEAPSVASLMAQLLWEESLDTIISWSESSRARAKDCAKAAWSASPPREALLRTAPTLRNLLLNKRKEVHTRHAAALKLGQILDDAGVQDLLRERGEMKDERTRLLLEAAIFASANPRAIPLLEDHVRQNPAPAGRAGALLQLRGMLPSTDYRALLQWVAQNDKDDENRRNALNELKGDGQTQP